MTLTKRELRLLRQALRIATGDGSLGAFASPHAIDRLAAKLEQEMAK